MRPNSSVGIAEGGLNRLPATTKTLRRISPRATRRRRTKCNCGTSRIRLDLTQTIPAGIVACGPANTPARHVGPDHSPDDYEQKKAQFCRDEPAAKISGGCATGQSSGRQFIHSQNAREPNPFFAPKRNTATTSPANASAKPGRGLAPITGSAETLVSLVHRIPGYLRAGWFDAFLAIRLISADNR